MYMFCEVGLGVWTGGDNILFECMSLFSRLDVISLVILS